MTHQYRHIPTTVRIHTVAIIHTNGDKQPHPAANMVRATTQSNGTKIETIPATLDHDTNTPKIPLGRNRDHRKPPRR